MAKEERWYFTKEELQNTVSRKCDIDPDKELSYRQQAANFIQDMGIRLPVNQLCINTAIVYMHRFYMFHSFTKFHRNAIATCALFLAAKVEEQPRKLEHVIQVGHACLYGQAPLDPQSDAFLEQAQQLVINENIMLQTLGFDVAIDHPHTHIVKCCQLVRASKDLAQTSYIMATTSLHLTSMCLQYKPTVVACVCIHLACKWANWEIPCSSEGKNWFWYVDKNVTLDLLKELTAEFLAILDKCPSRLKKTLMCASTGKDGVSGRKLKPEVFAGGNRILSGLTSSSSSNYSEKSCSPIVPPKNEKHEKQVDGAAGDMADASTSKHAETSEMPSTERTSSRHNKQNDPTVKYPSTSGHHSSGAGDRATAHKDQTKTQPVQHTSSHHPRPSVPADLKSGSSSSSTVPPVKKNHRPEKATKAGPPVGKERVDKVSTHQTNRFFKSNSPTAARHEKTRHRKDGDVSFNNHVNPSNTACSNGKETTVNRHALEVKQEVPPESDPIPTQVKTEPEEKPSNAPSVDLKRFRMPQSSESSGLLPILMRQTIKPEKVDEMALPSGHSHSGDRSRQSQHHHNPPQQHPVPQPHPTQQQHPPTQHSERHEKREKHKHKDRSSKYSSQQPQGSGNPRIKLTIPKERLSAPNESNGSGATAASSKGETGIKLKLSKQLYTAAQGAKDQGTSGGNGGGDAALKLKIKLPKAAKSNYEVKPSDRKREAPSDMGAATSPKMPRMETRVSRKEEEMAAQYQAMQQYQQQLQLQQNSQLQSLMSVNTFMQQQQNILPPDVNNMRHSRNKMVQQQQQFNPNQQIQQNSRKKNQGRSQRLMSGAAPPLPQQQQQQQQMPHIPQQHPYQQINVGPYQYQQFYPFDQSMMGGFYPQQQMVGGPPPAVDPHSTYHHPSSLGPPPLPRDPPPPMPPPPPE